MNFSNSHRCRRVLVRAHACCVPFGGILLVSVLASLARSDPGDLIKAIRPPIYEAYAFGDAMTLSGDDLVVSASNAFARVGFGPGPGEAYRIDIRNGQRLATYHNPSPVDGECFGCAVAAAGDFAYISTPRDSLGVPSKQYGVVHQFDRETGALIRAIQNPQPVNGEYFGHKIAAFDDKLAVAAPYPGRVYIFDAANGSLLKTLTRPGGDQDQAEFGDQMLATGDYIAVAAPSDNLSAFGAGAVYLFDSASGDYLRTLQAPTPMLASYFGASLAASDDSLFVGMLFGGSIRQYDLKTGDLIRTFVRPPGDQQSEFGTVFAANNGYLASVGGSFTPYAQIFDIETGDLVAQFNDPFATTGGTGFGGGTVIAAGDDFLFVSESHRYLSQVEGPNALPRVTLGVSHLNEPAVGSRDYSPGAAAQELGFRTAIVASPGANPQAGVAFVAGNALLAHQSVNATTTFDAVDLAHWQDVNVAIDVRISSTGYENNDLLYVFATNGTDRIELFRELGKDGATNDMLEAAAEDGFVTYSAVIPDQWSQVSLVIQSTTNSSAGSERFEFDNLRITAVAAVPEPSAMVLFCSGLGAAIAGCRFKRAASVQKNAL
jgi:hypothetical protein